MRVHCLASVAAITAQREAIPYRGRNSVLNAHPELIKIKKEKVYAGNADKGN